MKGSYLIKELILFRCKQVWRVAEDFSIPLSIIVLIIVLYFSNLSIELLSEISLFLPPVIWIGVLLIIQQNRKDVSFLQKIQLNKKVIYVAEYLSLSLIPAIMSSVKTQYVTAFLMLLTSLYPIVLPDTLLHRKSKKLQLNFLTIIPVQMFEIKGSLRQFFFPFSILYVIAILFCKVKGIPLIIELFITLLVCNGYQIFEPKEILELSLKKSSFLNKKIGINILTHLILIAPISLLHLTFFPSLWYLILYQLFVTSMLVSFCIAYKYALYTPLITHINNSLPIGMFLISLLIPFLIPVAIIMLIQYYLKANKNLLAYGTD